MKQSSNNIPVLNILWTLFRTFKMYSYFYRFLLLASLVRIIFTEIFNVKLKLMLREFLEGRASTSLLGKLFDIFMLEAFLVLVHGIGIIISAFVYNKHLMNIFYKSFSNLTYGGKDRFKNMDNSIVQNDFFIGGAGLGKVFFLLFSSSVSIIAGVCSLSCKFYEKFDLSFTIIITLLTIFCMIIHLFIIQCEVSFKKIANETQAEKRKVIYETIDNYENIVGSGTEDYEIRRFHHVLDKNRDSITWFDISRDTIGLISRVLFSCVKFGIFVKYILQEKDSQGDKLNILDTLLIISQANAYRIAKAYRSFRNHILDSSLIHKYLETDFKRSTGKAFTGFSSSIEFRDVKVTHEGITVFDNVNITIEKGDNVAIIGKNGAGKSTLMRTLLGFQPYTGSILLDGVPLSEYSSESVISSIGYVPQKITLFDNSILYNITYGLDKKVQSCDINKVCSDLDFLRTIENRPNRYLSSCGEGGRRLSGGERQKIILIRSFLKNAQIYLMDEPFSSLDEDVQKDIFRYIDIEKKDATFFMVLHQGDHLKHFNKIIYVDNGTAKVYNSYDEIV